VMLLRMKNVKRNAVRNDGVFFCASRIAFLRKQLLRRCCGVGNMCEQLFEKEDSRENEAAFADSGCRAAGE
jgi:hypothetical protein